MYRASYRAGFTSMIWLIRISSLVVLYMLERFLAEAQENLRSQYECFGPSPIRAGKALDFLKRRLHARKQRFLSSRKGSKLLFMLDK